MVEITQEELDKLRALQARENTRIKEGAPLGAPEGEGLAARSIADYLRGPQRVIKRGGGYGPLSSDLSYGTNTNSTAKDYHKMAAERAAARDRGASLAQLQAADAEVRRQSENPFGYNDRQTKALELAWSSSPDKVALDAKNAERARQGLGPIGSTYGQNYYHTNKDGSRDYNYSKEGVFRGDVPDEFRNPDANSANTHLAHWDSDTNSWKEGDLSITETFKDIGGGLMDAYGNIRETIPLIGQEVISGVKDAYGRIKGEAPAPLSDAEIRANSLANASVALNAQKAVQRDRESASSKAQKAANRAQLQKKANAYTASKVKNVGAAKAGVSGFAEGGPAGPLSPIAQTMVDDEENRQIQQMQLMQAQKSQPGALGQVKGQLIGQAASAATKALFGGATGGIGGLIGGIFGEDGGVVAPTEGAGSPGIPPEVQQVAQALAAGQMGPEEAVAALVEMGVPQEQAMQLVKAAMSQGGGGPTGPLAGPAPFANGGMVGHRMAGGRFMDGASHSTYNDGGPVSNAADVLVEELSSRRPAGLQLPTQQFGHGGKVAGMAIPGGGPVKKVKTQKKSSQGHGSNDELMEIEFDTAVPPMSNMAMSALGKLR